MQALYHAIERLGAQILGQHLSTFQTWVKSAETQKNGVNKSVRVGAKHES